MVMHFLCSYTLDPSENPEAIIGQRKRLRLQLQAVTAMPLSLPRYDNDQEGDFPFLGLSPNVLAPLSVCLRSIC